LDVNAGGTYSYHCASRPVEEADSNGSYAYKIVHKMKFLLYVTPNAAIEWLASLFRIPEVFGSNLSLETGYPGVFMVFLRPSRQIPG
jgi:hypothetical protein